VFHCYRYLAVSGGATAATQNHDAMAFCIMPRVFYATTSAIDYIG